MMRPENDADAPCNTQGCTVTVNLWDYPEALCDPCGEVVCNSCGPCTCGGAA